MRLSVLEITADRIVIGVQGLETTEMGGEPYHDIYYCIGEGMESDTLQYDLEAWEEEFFIKLTHPGSKLEVTGEISNIRESRLRGSEEDDEIADA